MAWIYIVEDDPDIGEIESIALKNTGYQTEICPTAADFYKKINERIPQLVLLDIMLPDEDGNSILAKLRNQPNTRRLPVIMVTAKTTELDKVRGLDGGADDYLTKPFGVMELISRVRALLRRTEDKKEETMLRIGRLFIDHQKHSVYVDDQPVELTYKEYELLRYLAKNHGIVLTREQIMEKIWGTDYEGESRTLDVHVQTLRHKLKAAGPMLKTMRNVGYYLEEEK